MESRQKKQIIVAVVFFVVLFGLGFGGYKIVVPAKPLPTPNPTANLSPLVVLSSKLLNIGNSDYDFVAKISNSNTDYGSGNVQYLVTFMDSSGKSLATKTGSFYILPGQTRYVVLTPLSLATNVASAEFKVVSVGWRRLDQLAVQGGNLISKNVDFIAQPNSSTFAKVGGAISNASDLDFDVVDVVVVVLGSSDDVLAVNRTTINTFLGKTERGFEVSWFKPFVGVVQRTEVQAGTNVFNNSNFLRRYGGSERFQQFY